MYYQVHGQRTNERGTCCSNSCRSTSRCRDLVKYMQPLDWDQLRTSVLSLVTGMVSTTRQRSNVARKHKHGALPTPCVGQHRIPHTATIPAHPLLVWRSRGEDRRLHRLDGSQQLLQVLLGCCHRCGVVGSPQEPKEVPGSRCRVGVRRGAGQEHICLQRLLR
jgi:hypothetical protein